MSFVVLDTDVLSSASLEKQEREEKGWRLLQCLIQGQHVLVVSPNLWKEYQRIPNFSAAGRQKLSTFAFTEKFEVDSEPQNVEVRARLGQLGVDEKDVEWVLLAVKHKAVFVTWEKYASRRWSGERRERKHQKVVSEVRDEFGVHIWHPDHALKRLCPRSP